MAKYTGVINNPKTRTKKGYLEVGDSGQDVKDVQKFINWFYGTVKLNADGKYGQETKKYVAAFERKMNIKADGQWGYEDYKKAKSYSKSAKKKKNVDVFIALMKTYNTYVKANGKHFKRVFDNPASTFAEAVKCVNAKKTARINCRAPVCWAFHAMKFSPATIWASKGSFKSKYKGTMTKHLNRITSGGPVGMTVKKAVDAGLLKKGDICCFKDITHTFTYSGTGYYFYDGGELAEKRGYSKHGIYMNYNVGYYKDKKISQVLRWKD